jgi:hypothetical protein
MWPHKFALVIFFIGFTFSVHAQETFRVRGKVVGPEHEPVPGAHLRLKHERQGTVTGADGRFTFEFRAFAGDSLIVSSVGYRTRAMALDAVAGDDSLVVVLEKKVQKISRVKVSSMLREDPTLLRIDKKDFARLPAAAGQVESIIKKMPGVSSHNELSSSYSVRGGNYDENLVYVNGIEIYRPIIVRNGKHEGLSFLNSDMVSSLHFSAGGFPAKYGDKMASVLDIRYRQPRQFSADLEMSLLGGSVHLEDTVGSRFTYNTGFRYKSNRYLLNSLDVEGDYEPSFYDLQTFLTYRLNEETDLEFLGNYNLNRYRFIPQSRETSFGTIGNILNMKVYYEGQEEDRFENYMGSLALNYHPDRRLNLRVAGAVYRTLESENYDILGQYYLNELDQSMDSDTYRDSIMNIGVGSYLDHARNEIDGRIFTFLHRGTFNQGEHLVEWGVTFKRELLRGSTNEWTYLDSAGYSIPRSDHAVRLFYSRNSGHSIRSSRFTAYIQDTYHFHPGWGEWHLNAGVRAAYWDFNQELLLSPRFSLSMTPPENKDLSFHLAGGYYAQPPFYKELIQEDGSINREIRAQRSLHLVMGAKYDFMAWDRPFHYQAELYYKKLDRLIPYKVDNVRIDYTGRNMARGYAAGLDMKVNGEFVPGVQSWASLSLMQTQADIRGDYYHDDQGRRVEPGFYPRPTDQLVNFSLFFQDYVPNHPSWKLQLSLHYGSKLPFTPPHTDRYDQVYRMPPYRRVDMGFSKMISTFRHIRSLWLGLEVFNLLDIKNTISYQWVRTVANQQGRAGQYAVPNYLTSRRLNLKLVLKL